MYDNRGITISIYNGNNVFRILIQHIVKGNLNFITRDKDVGPIEKNTRIVKELTRCMVHYLSSIKYLAKTMEQLVYEVDYKLNTFQDPNAVHHASSPNTIVRRTPRVDYNMINIVPSAYVQIYEETTKNMRSQAIGIIVLRTSNDHGSCHFISL